MLDDAYVYKVKIGLDKLDDFINNGVTVSGQESLFNSLPFIPRKSSAKVKSAT